MLLSTHNGKPKLSVIQSDEILTSKKPLNHTNVFSMIAPNLFRFCRLYDTSIVCGCIDGAVLSSNEANNIELLIKPKLEHDAPQHIICTSSDEFMEALSDLSMFVPIEVEPVNIKCGDNAYSCHSVGVLIGFPDSMGIDEIDSVFKDVVDIVVESDIYDSEKEESIKRDDYFMGIEFGFPYDGGVALDNPIVDVRVNEYGIPRFFDNECLSVFKRDAFLDLFDDIVTKPQQLIVGMEVS